MGNKIHKRLAALLMAVAIPLIATAGCGGDGGSDGAYSVEAGTTVTATSITRGRFLRHINKVCRQAWGRIRELFNEYRNSHLTLDRRERFAEAVRIPLLSSITFLIFDDMRMLGAPLGEEREIEGIIGPLQAAVELGQKRRPVLHSVAEIEKHFAEYNQRARQYGLGDCLVSESHLRIQA